MEIKMNETRTKILKALENADGKDLTLAEISQEIGVEVKTGTTNALVSAGLIKKVGTRKVPKQVWVEVATYTIGEVKPDGTKTE